MSRIAFLRMCAVTLPPEARIAIVYMYGGQSDFNRRRYAVFSPGIWLIGSRMNRSGSDVQILQMYS